MAGAPHGAGSRSEMSHFFETRRGIGRIFQVPRFAVVYCVDENYVDYAAVSVFSLLTNSRQGRPRIYVFSDLGADRLKAAFGWMYRESSIEFVASGELAASLPDTPMPARNISHWTPTSWLRVFVPNALPEDRLLYLDSDTIVDCDIARLAELDIGSAIVGGVRERLFERQALRALNKDPGADIYLNAGVLLINSEAWRRNHVTSRVIEFRSGHDCRWIDQDALNGALSGEEKAQIPARYNITTHYYIVTRKSFAEEYAGGIIHYTGPDKPWAAWMNDPSKKIWQAYYALSPLRDKDISVMPRNIRESLAYGDKMASEGRHEEGYRELRRVVRAEMKDRIGFGKL